MPRDKLTEAQIQEIIDAVGNYEAHCDQLYEDTIGDLAVKFNVSSEVIKNIADRV